MIKAGEGVILSNQSANRDETVFKNPDQFDIHRAPGAQIGFGYGTHVCVAEWLARAELECVFGAYTPSTVSEPPAASRLSNHLPLWLAGTLFQKLPNLQVAVPMDQVKYTDLDKDVGITELPVTW